MVDILRELAGGDRRSIGRANAIVLKVFENPQHFASIVAGLASTDRVVRMRCADVAEKISIREPGWLSPHKAFLMGLVESATEPELRWHLLQLIPRLQLTAKERRKVVAILFADLKSKSRIVCVCALQSLVDLSDHDDTLRQKLLPVLRGLSSCQNGALGARSRKLLGRLDEQ